MKDGYKKFIADSLLKVWCDDTIYKRETQEYTDYYIHLINTPETELAVETTPNDPPAADDVEISTKLFSNQEKIRAWAIHPYGYDAEILERFSRKSCRKRTKRNWVFRFRHSLFTHCSYSPSQMTREITVMKYIAVFAFIGLIAISRTELIAIRACGMRRNRSSSASKSTVSGSSAVWQEQHSEIPA